ncbi:cysteine dioxygenase family protein [Plantactinospora sp. S1510]|uniref:Cysteine dioxygenase family protein n=2 Tax=Plantactinospora alkalitolerans TaxID=2789879 RepID=A0ABS0HAH8_9ACTN|nr:cysteine dioxygenase family protein [Plantactinospora alkalitolerans]
MAGTVLQHVITPPGGGSVAGSTDDLVAGVRQAIGTRAGWARTAELVAGQLRAYLPDPDLLTPEQQLGHPDRPAGHVLHAEPDGTFSILGLVWRPGQSTRIHDHITWCVVGVLQGVEHEDLYDVDLNLIGTRENHVGEVSGFAPPGDIHRIRNTGTRTAISLHIYGTDITRIGSSARRYYN